MQGYPGHLVDDERLVDLRDPLLPGLRVAVRPVSVAPRPVGPVGPVERHRQAALVRHGPQVLLVEPLHEVVPSPVELGELGVEARDGRVGERPREPAVVVVAPPREELRAGLAVVDHVGHEREQPVPLPGQGRPHRAEQPDPLAGGPYPEVDANVPVLGDLARPPPRSRTSGRSATSSRRRGRAFRPTRGRRRSCPSPCRTTSS